MPIELDHLIVPVNDATASLHFDTDVLGFENDGYRRPFTVVRVSERLTLQLAPWGTEGNMHLAFAMTADSFDQAFARIRTLGVPFGDTFHESDNMRGPGDEEGARGPGKAIYAMDPNKHLIELRFYDDPSPGHREDPSVRRWVNGSSTGGPEREVPPPVLKDRYHSSIR